MKMHDAIYLNGKWTSSDGDGTLEVVNATTEEVIATVPRGTSSDVARAVEAARSAQEGWAVVSVAERAGSLREVAAGLRLREQELLETIVAEVGTTRALAAVMQVGIGIDTFVAAADDMEAADAEERIGNSLVVRVPVGVAGCITPWNYPLYQVSLKVGPALAAGCSVVLKPSEVAPLSAFILAEVIDAVGLPAGVFNLVSGDGPTVGEAMVMHPEVDAVSFTGSVRAGRRVAELAGASVKRVTLELGGKSPTIILPGADLEAAVAHGVMSCMNNAGQTCGALSRMIVLPSIREQVEQLATNAATMLRLGDPMDESTRLGPVASAAQRDRVLSYIQRGIDEGAQLLTGGPERPSGQPRGYFVQPTVFTAVDPSMTIAREEIFGPVLSIMEAADEDQALALANGTPYALSGAVWASETARARAVAERLHASTVSINGGRFNPAAPFGGARHSGYGRERGRFGLEEYLQTKSFQY